MRSAYSVCHEAFPQPNIDEIRHIHGSPVLDQSFLCDDFPAKISLYLLLRIEHSDILDPNGSLSEDNTGTQIATNNPLPTKV